MSEKPTRLPAWARRVFWTVVTIEWTVALSGCAAFAIHGVWVIDYMTCTPDVTSYAAGYSEKEWASVQLGDSQASVTARLGNPLETWEHTDDLWWSFSAHGTGSEDYRERKLRFDRTGHVIDKHEACYLD